MFVKSVRDSNLPLLQRATSSCAANAGVLRVVVAGLTLEGKLLWVRVKSFEKVALLVNLLSRQLPNQRIMLVLDKVHQSPLFVRWSCVQDQSPKMLRLSQLHCRGGREQSQQLCSRILDAPTSEILLDLLQTCYYNLSLTRH